MENIVHIADLPSFIDQVINQVNEGVVLARKRGILAEFPEDGGTVQFDVTVVFKWQDPDLAIIGLDTSTGSDKGNNTSITTKEDKGESTSSQEGGSERVNEEKSQTRRTSEDAGTSAGTNTNYTYTD